MGAIRLIQKSKNGQITFNVPDEMRDKPIIIEFRPAKEESQPTEESQTKETTLAEAAQAFFAKLNRVKTDFTEGDYNVYEQ
ncbi:hypothetical protein [Spirosoma pulveris]